MWFYLSHAAGPDDVRSHGPRCMDLAHIKKATHGARSNTHGATADSERGHRCSSNELALSGRGFRGFSRLHCEDNQLFTEEQSHGLCARA